ncbi:TPA: hypothetical protein DIT45_03965 [Candidatus Acetothermia bacterium]|nr:hypothetical protein [Candidatus Acetothermia bacterium]
MGHTRDREIPAPMAHSCYLLQSISLRYSDYRDGGQRDGESSSQPEVTDVGDETFPLRKVYIVGEED